MLITPPSAHRRGRASHTSDSLKKIAVIGDDGHVNPQALDKGSGGVNPPFIITPLQAISEEAAMM